MMTYAYNVALSEYDPQLCYLSNKRYYKDKFVNTLYKLVKGSYQEEVFRDMNGIAVDSPISLLHCMQYADVKGTWNEVLEKFDVFFCVGGSSHSAYPLYKSGKKYSIWIATPYADDRIDRIADYSLIKKTQEAISFPFDMKMEREILHSGKSVV